MWDPSETRALCDCRGFSSMKPALHPGWVAFLVDTTGTCILNSRKPPPLGPMLILSFRKIQTKLESRRKQKAKIQTKTKSRRSCLVSESILEMSNPTSYLGKHTYPPRFVIVGLGNREEFLGLFTKVWEGFKESNQGWHSSPWWGASGSTSKLKDWVRRNSYRHLRKLCGKDVWQQLKLWSKDKDSMSGLHRNGARGINSQPHPLLPPALLASSLPGQTQETSEFSWVHRGTAHKSVSWGHMWEPSLIC